MKKRFGRRKAGSTEMVLQITSMADIFTILLVFLLKSFSSGATTISPITDITLPDVASANDPIETTKIEISTQAVFLDDKEVVSLQKFRMPASQILEDGTSKALQDAFTRSRQKDTTLKNPRMLVMADQSVPFSTIRTVLTSAANAGFAEFKLVVVENE
jgi:biopolymer transport protein ExbD